MKVVSHDGRVFHLRHEVGCYLQHRTHHKAPDVGGLTGGDMMTYDELHESNRTADDTEINATRNGHIWQTKDNHVYLFAYERGEYHNGPRCVNCNYGYCHHCHNDVPPEACKEV